MLVIRFSHENRNKKFRFFTGKMSPGNFFGERFGMTHRHAYMSLLNRPNVRPRNNDMNLFNFVSQWRALNSLSAC